jgi:hypothetical protein
VREVMIPIAILKYFWMESDSAEAMPVQAFCLPAEEEEEGREVEKEVEAVGVPEVRRPPPQHRRPPCRSFDSAC